MIPGRRIAAGLSAISIAIGVGACSGSGHPATSTSTGDPPASTVSGRTAAATAPGDFSEWLLTRQALAEVAANGAARRKISDDPIDELLQPGQQPLPGVPARVVVSFDSATALESAIRSGDLPRHTWGVLFDPEAWTFTPSGEQHHPVAAARTAASVAHAHGLIFIVAPALDLVKVLAPDGHGTSEQRFLAMGLVGGLAREADVVELQAQSLERDRDAYRSFLDAAAAQAHAANPKVRLLAGLSTNPPGSSVSVSQLRGDIAATRSAVGGYWLNVPGQGARCPTCGAPQPQLAIALTLRP